MLNHEALRAAAALAAEPDSGEDGYWPDATITPIPVSPPTIAHTDDWRARAACVGIPADVFFPTESRNGIYDDAVAICDECPVRAECLDANIHEKYGVWGGTTPRRRRRLRVELGVTPQARADYTSKKKGTA